MENIKKNCQIFEIWQFLFNYYLSVSYCPHNQLFAKCFDFNGLIEQENCGSWNIFVELVKSG